MVFFPWPAGGGKERQEEDKDKHTKQRGFSLQPHAVSQVLDNGEMQHWIFGVKGQQHAGYMNQIPVQEMPHSTSTLYIVHCTLYIVHRTSYIVHRTSYIVHRTPYIVHCTLYIVHCTLYIVHCTLYIVHCTLYIVHCTLYIVHCTLYIVHCTLYIVHCTLYIVHCTLYIVHCTLYIVHCTLYIVHCTLYIVHCTLYIDPIPNPNSPAASSVSQSPRYRRFSLSQPLRDRRRSHHTRRAFVNVCGRRNALLYQD